MALPPTPTTVPVSHGSGLRYRTRSCSLVHVRFLTSAFAPLSTSSAAVPWYSRSFCLGTVFVRIVKFVSVRDCHGRSHTCKLGHVHFGSPAESFPAFSGYAVFLGQKYPSFAPTPQLCFCMSRNRYFLQTNYGGMHTCSSGRVSFKTTKPKTRQEHTL